MLGTGHWKRLRDGLLAGNVLVKLADCIDVTGELVTAARLISRVR